MERLMCVHGRPRTGTTSIAGELNASPVYAVWIEKDLWATRTYETREELLDAARRPGGTSGMARRYNEDVVSRKDGFSVLGDKSTFMSRAGERDGFALTLSHLSTTATNLALEHEIIACVREPVSWLAAWAMTHYLREAGPDRSFFETMTDRPRVRELLERELDGYHAHLQVVLASAHDSRVHVRCLGQTPIEEFTHPFTFAEYVRRAAPAPFRSGSWPGFLEETKTSLEAWTRGWACARDTWDRLLEHHRPYPVVQADGTRRCI